MSGREVRYNISGEASVQISFLLTTPLYGGNYTFTLQTYTQNSYTIGRSTTNYWQHNCFGTECRSCDSTNACIDCYSSSIPSTKNIFNTQNSDCVDACNSGYFLVGTECSICNSNCRECETQATNCTRCHNGTYLQTTFDTCVTDCGSGFYANTLNDLCTQCSSPCLTCTSDTFCLSCVDGTFLLNNECPSTCPSGIMVANSLTKTCDFCDPNCLTC